MTPPAGRGQRDDATTDARPQAAEPIRQFRFTRPSNAADLLLVRHGESQPFSPDRPHPLVGGQGDPPLDPRGEAEAERVAERLAGEDVDAIYVTTLRRTRQTAAPLARRLGLEPKIEADLREVHLGEWEGGIFRLRVREGGPVVREMFTVGRWDVIPGAEAHEAFAARVRSGITRIAVAERDRRVAVVTHGGVIAMVMGLATGGRVFAFVGADNGSITQLVVPAEGDWVVRRFNDTGHLHTDLDRPPEPLV